MTRSSRPPNWEARAGEVREASRRCHEQGPKSFDHFTELVNGLLCMTIGHADAVLRLTSPRSGRDTGQLLSGVVELTNSHYLRLVISLYLDSKDRYLRTSMSLFQYQVDAMGNDWVFRYEYKRVRNPGETKPACHLQIRGHLTSGGVLPERKLLERVHFPCGRPAVESTIRCLIDDFGVRPDAPENVWRPLLADCEKEFLEHAHHLDPS